MPPYILAVCLFMFIWPWGGFSLESPYRMLQFLTHLPAMHNLHPDTVFGINPSFWTIAVEVQLYALYPALLWLQRRFGWRTALGVLGATEFLIRSWPPVELAGPDFVAPTFIVWSPFAFWFSWSLGAYAADCYLAGRASHLSRIRFDVVLLLVALVPVFRPTNSLGFPVFALASAIIIDRLRSGAWRIPQWIAASRVWTHLSFLGVMSISRSSR
jgi:peptidoglycan/LPS O-acetylase OafA/YrhL